MLFVCSLPPLGAFNPAITACVYISIPFIPHSRLMSFSFTFICRTLHPLPPSMDRAAASAVFCCLCIFPVCRLSPWFLRATACYSAYATPIPSVCPFVCHTRAVSKRLNASSKFFHCLGRIILVFRHQRSLCKSDGFTPNGGSKYKGGSNFRPI